MNKWRRQHKQRLRGRLSRLRAFKSWMRGALMAQAAAVGRSQIHTLRATPAARFKGGEVEKISHIAAVVICTNKAIESARASIP